MLDGSTRPGIRLSLLATAAWLLVLTVAISAASAEEVVAWSPELGSPATRDQPGAAEVITSMYAKAEAMLTGSGHDVTIAVDGFDHLSWEEMARVPWLDLVTADGPRLVLGKHYLGLQGVEERLVHVSAEWRDPLRRSAAETHPGLTAVGAAQILDQPGFGEEIGGIASGRTVAVSAYRVHLEALDESRDYGAAVFWRQLEGGDYAAMIQDHVLAIDQIVWLDESPSPRLELEALEDHLGTTPDKPFSTKAVCTIKEGDFNGTLQTGSRTTGHRTGWHLASFALRSSWSCDRSCRATCNARLQSPNCFDAGGSFHNLEVTSHKPFVASDQKSQSAPGGATCVGAFQCAFSECKGAVCPGISVGVSILGSGVNFSNASGAVDKFNLQDSFGISCSPVPPPPPCLVTSTTTKALTLGGEVPVFQPKSAFTLDNVEASDVFHHGARVNYVLDEWALFEHHPDVGTTLGRTSSRALARARKSVAGEVAAAKAPQGAFDKSGGGPQPILLIEAPYHPDNDRAIPLPALAFDAEALPAGLPQGRMIVRLDVDDYRQLQDLTVIYDGFGGAPPDLLTAIEERFRLSFASDKEHRVVTYAVLEVGESISVVDHIVLLPKCCPICPPRDHLCNEP